MGLLRSFGFAFSGLGHLIRTQRNFRIELAAAAVVIVAGVAYGLERAEWLAVTLTIALVLILESINTALEHAVTLASASFNERARVAKDVSASAVLIAAIASVVVGLVVFGPRLVR